MLLFFLFASLSPIECPKWLPNTNQILPAGVTLSKAQLLKNNLRCYCEIVVPLERGCLENYSQEQCTQRTKEWVNINIVSLSQELILLNKGPRWRIMSIVP